MATFNFSALSDGQSVGFQPGVDVLRFDQSTIAAGDVRISASGTGTRVEVLSGPSAGKDVLLTNTTPLQLFTGNVTFADGSRLLAGDNSVSQNDNAANALAGTLGRDLFYGFGGNDTMSGGDGADVFVIATSSAPSYGDDSVNGGSGRDIVDFSGAQSAVTGNLARLTGGGANGTGSVTMSAVDGIIGGAFNDNLRGNGGSNQLLEGGGGNDTLDSSGGSGDTLIGGAGDDTYFVYLNETLIESSGIDTVVSNSTWNLAEGFENLTFAGAMNVSGSGNSANNIMTGNVGNNGLTGHGGNDVLTGGAGLDSFGFSDAPSASTVDRVTDFFSGADRLVFAGNVYNALGPNGSFVAGDARFAAGAGFTSGRDTSDRLVYDTSTGNLYYDADGSGAGAAQLVATFAGNPMIAATDIQVSGGAESSTIFGTEGDDTLSGTPGDDHIEARGGNDLVNGLGGADLLFAGPGNDFVQGDDGNDTIFGGDGNDTSLEGNAGNDHIFAEGGDDALNGGSGDDRLNGGAGNDLFGMLSWGFDVPAGGNDGNDAVDGGDGIDLISFSIEGVSSTGAVTVDLASGTYRVSSALGSAAGTALNVERIQGSWFNDSITGSASANFFDGAGGNDSMGGAGGNDTLQTHEGNDVLAGGVGNDTVTSGRGTDRLLFAETPGDANADLVTDFAAGSDTLVLDGRAMAALGASGRFSAGDARFHAAAGATVGHDADDRVVYNTASGELFYDADGSGAGAAQRIGTLEGAPTLAAGDIEVVNGGTPPPPPPGPTPTLQGTEGSDTLTGTAGADVIDGRGGNDLISALGGDDFVIGGAGNDTMSGSDGADRFVMMLAGVSNYGVDSINGGSGRDIVDFSGAQSAVTGSLTGLSGGGAGGAGSVTMSAVDGIIGGAFNDNLRGNGGSNQLLEGGAGNDTLDSVAGTDTLTGGAGADRFIAARPGVTDADLITDFVSGADRLVLNPTLHAGVGSSGDFTGGDERFHSAAGATTALEADDRVIYNLSTGELYYDPDGTGAAAAQLMATLQGAPALVSTDFTVL